MRPISGGSAGSSGHQPSLGVPSSRLPELSGRRDDGTPTRFTTAFTSRAKDQSAADEHGSIPPTIAPDATTRSQPATAIPHQNPQNERRTGSVGHDRPSPGRKPEEPGLASQGWNARSDS